MVFFSDQDGKQGIYNCWPNTTPSCLDLFDNKSKLAWSSGLSAYG